MLRPFCIYFLIFCAFGKFYAVEKHELAVCALFQNEAAYMKEWIEFHKLVGVQHFYLYNDHSEDNYLQVLEPYIKNGEVELFECVPKRNGTFEEFVRMQTSTYMHCIKKKQSSCKMDSFY